MCEYTGSYSSCVIFRNHHHAVASVSGSRRHIGFSLRRMKNHCETSDWHQHWCSGISVLLSLFLSFSICIVMCCALSFIIPQVDIFLSKGISSRRKQAKLRGWEPTKILHNTIHLWDIYKISSNSVDFRTNWWNKIHDQEQLLKVSAQKCACSPSSLVFRLEGFIKNNCLIFKMVNLHCHLSCVAHYLLLFPKLMFLYQRPSHHDASKQSYEAGNQQKCCTTLSNFGTFSRHSQIPSLLGPNGQSNYDLA